jgi:hypothetical protein
MLHPQLESLMSEEGFLEDLPAMASLSDAAYNDILSLILKKTQGDDHTLRFEDISHSTVLKDTDRETIRNLVSLSAALGSFLRPDSASIEETVIRFQKDIGNRVANPDAFLSYVRALAAASDQVRAARDRFELVEDGGRTLSEISFSYDLRAALKNDLPTNADSVAGFQADVTELVPVVLVRISFAKTDDGDDVTFQMRSGEIQRLLSRLQGVERVLKTLSERVTLRR